MILVIMDSWILHGKLNLKLECLRENKREALKYFLWELCCVFTFCEHLEVERVGLNFLPLKQESSANKPRQFFALSCINCFHPPFCSNSNFSLHELKDEINCHLWCYFLEFLLFLEQEKAEVWQCLGWFPLPWDTWKAQEIPHVDFPPSLLQQEPGELGFCIYLPSSIYCSGNSFLKRVLKLETWNKSSRTLR